MLPKHGFAGQHMGTGIAEVADCVYAKTHGKCDEVILENGKKGGILQDAVKQIAGNKNDEKALSGYE